MGALPKQHTTVAFDKGAISPVIQPKNSSREPSSGGLDPELLCIPRNKMQDSKRCIRRE